MLSWNFEQRKSGNQSKIYFVLLLFLFQFFFPLIYDSSHSRNNSTRMQWYSNDFHQIHQLSCCRVHLTRNVIAVQNIMLCSIAWGSFGGFFLRSTEVANDFRWNAPELLNSCWFEDVITQFDHRRHQVGRIICILIVRTFNFSATQIASIEFFPEILSSWWLQIGVIACVFSKIIWINRVCQSPNKTTTKYAHLHDYLRFQYILRIRYSI